MKKYFYVILFICLLGSVSFAQKQPAPRSPATVNLPEIYSSVYDIRQFGRYSIVVFGVPDYRKSGDEIRKVLDKEGSIKFTDKRNEVPFYIFYRETKTGSEMRVKYFTRDKTVSVWAEDRNGKGKEVELAEAFLKVLQRNKKLDVPDEPGDAK